MTTLSEFLHKKASDIAKRDVIFSYPQRNKKLIRSIFRKGDATERTYKELVEQVKTLEYLPPEAEWVFDHFYLVQHRWLDLKTDFDVKTFLSLPQLGSGPFKGYPRVYNLVVQLLLLTHNRMNAKRVTSFLQGYQKHKPLFIAELTALPHIITLEVILSFQKKLEEIIDHAEQVRHADTVFENVVTKAKGDPRTCARLLAKEIDVARPYFINRLWRKLEGGGRDHRTLQRWLESHLHTKNSGISLIRAHIEKRRQRSEAFFANTINTLKWLPNVDWSELIERSSAVEKILRQDPMHAYAHMDEQGRAFYRGKVRIIAKKFQVNEVDIAKAALALAKAHREEQSETGKKSHVGYFLIEEGYEDLERAFEYKRTWKDKIKRFVVRTRTYWFFGSIIFFTLVSTLFALPFLPLSHAMMGPASVMVTILLGMEIAVIATNYLISRIVPPRVPVRLFFKELPKEHKTVVVLNSILNTKEGIRTVMKNMETNHLNSIDEHIVYAVLFDFKDSTSQEEEADRELLEYAQSRIAKLNARYCKGMRDKFFLFCRSRTWNPQEQLFMGWERKRGKLLEFNKFLLGEGSVSFFTPTAIPAALKDVQYVITLDEDNVLPKESAKLLIGTLAHPLNKPVYDTQQERVTEGYTVIQPHIGIRLPYAHRSLFSKIFSLPTVIDPHTHALSNVYQDVFESGIYVGKGIYEPRTFIKALEGKIPENTVLSHDLLEGAYAKTGLASDIAIFENFPSQFNAHLLRMHRWIRGDWQLLDWLFPYVKGADGNKHLNTLPAIERWKILDNIRRSLLSTTLFAGTLLGVFMQSFPILVYTGAAFSLPFILPILSYLTRRHKHIPLSNLAVRLGGLILTGLTQVFFRLVFLVAHTSMELSAIALIVFRKFVSKRKLLEWQTYQELVTTLKGTWQETFKIMAAPFIISLIFAGYVALSQNLLLYPFALFWVLAPFLAYAISKPPAPYIPRNLKREEMISLRTYAARIWAYYHSFVNQESNFLPPDNVQHEKFIAYATSPTNIGAYLVAMVSAYKLGHITPAEFLTHADLALNTVSALKKERGHLYNWYNIKTLEPNFPEYISSVDSGNFVASLFVLQGALRELRDHPDIAISKNVQESLQDYFHIVQETATPLRGVPRIRKLCDQLAHAMKEEDLTLVPPIAITLTELETFMKTAPHPETYEDLLFWTSYTRGRIQELMHGSSWFASNEQIEPVLSQVKSLIRGTDFRFLYNKERSLFQIGHNTASGKKDEASYDLFGSEANIASFISIVLNQIRQTHWKKLGRTLINSKKGPVLLSWGGSLFEYINNLIFFRTIPSSLLWENGKKVIRMHMAYAQSLGIPWGMSESSHFASKTSDTIHYRIFGVPDIGVKRDLTQYHVVAPYASFLSLSFFPQEVVKNLARLRKLGAFGRYGFYDAVDFAHKTHPRVVPVYYAHHLGFSAAAICNYIKDNSIQTLFSNNPYVRAGEYLLEELYIVDTKPSRLPRKEQYAQSTQFETAGMPIKEFVPAYTESPQSIFLSNGKLSAMASNNGMTRLAYKDTLLTPFSQHKDAVSQGWHILLRDTHSRDTWFPAPPRSQAQSQDVKYRVGFYDNLAEYQATYKGIDSRVEVTVSPHEHMEVRKVTLENTTDEVKSIDMETHGVASLAREKKELSAPYFHRLFLRSTVNPDHGIWQVTRAHIFPDEEHIQLVHWISSPERKIPVRPISSLRKFWDNERTWFDPESRFGSVAHVELKPKERISLYCVTGAAPHDQDMRPLVNKYRSLKYCQDLFEKNFQYENQYLRELNINYTKARTYRILGSKLFWKDPSLRATHDPQTSLQRGGRDFLWKFGISGDFPLVIVSAGHMDDIPRVKDFLQAFMYAYMKGVVFDLIILDEEEKSYTEPFREQIETILYAEHVREKGHAHFISKSAFSQEEISLLKQIAIAHFRARHDIPITSYHEKEEQYRIAGSQPASCSCTESRAIIPSQDLSFFNGHGGFSKEKEGAEYVIYVDKKRPLQAPWSNILSNERFGCVTSHEGLGSTWYLNSQQNRITDWHALQGRARVSELFYMQENACTWSLTPSPLPDNNTYKVVHGKGYTRYEHTNHGIRSVLKVWVHPETQCKFYMISFENETDQDKDISLLSFFPLVLGEFPEFQQPLRVDYEESKDIFTAEQLMANAAGSTHIGVWSSEKTVSWTGHRPHIFPWNAHDGRPLFPTHMRQEEPVISSSPCIAFTHTMTIPKKKKKDVTLLLAADATKEGVEHIIREFQKPKAASYTARALEHVWERTGSTISIHTPSPSLNILFNHWLLYQTISSRLYAKTGIYQQGGATGFRDQIQDILALVWSDPTYVREKLLVFASKQFIEGDALNWWHDPEGFGIRTLVSDTHLWLPYAVSYYIQHTGDMSILDEQVPYLTSHPVDFGQERSWMGVPDITQDKESLYEHIVRAMRKSFQFGARGLPLMGANDWNDGLNRVGSEGKGESVWLAFFLLHNLSRYIPIAKARKDDAAVQFTEVQEALHKAVLSHGWHGKWFARAFHDTGHVIGTDKNKEYKIDLLTQAWSVLVGMGDLEKQQKLLKTAFDLLYDKQERILSLLTPPIPSRTKIPYGYIQGYPEYTRENGAQYNHAAMWFLEAAARVKRPDLVRSLLESMNPITRSDTERKAAAYRVEPYVIAADIWKEKNHLSQGGWTWYTASSGLFYRVFLEDVLGVKVRNGNTLTLDPCVPADWKEYELSYTFGKTVYHIHVRNTSQQGYGKVVCTVDGDTLAGNEIPLQDDGTNKEVRVVLEPTEEQERSPGK